MNHAITNKLAECLTAKGINQSQLARRFGLSRAHVSRLVRASVQPSLGLALRLAGYFGRPIESIFTLPENGQQSISQPPSVALSKLTNNQTGTMKGKSK